MRGRCSGSGPAYELTVSGSLGPVLRHALRPFARASSELQTVLRVEAAEAELTEVMACLESRGVEVHRIQTLRPDGEGDR